jgi:hypothetical protein
MVSICDAVSIRAIPSSQNDTGKIRECAEMELFFVEQLNR